MERNLKQVLGFNVDIISFDDAVNVLVERIRNNQGTHVVTINPEIIESAQANEELSSILQNAELVVADGSGIKYALLFKGIKQDRIPGVDLAYKMLEYSASNNFKVALIGAKQEVIEAAEKNIKNSFPEIDICYCRNGYFSSDEEEEIISDIKSSKPQLVLAALGSPKQEIFIQKIKKQLPNTTFIGIGGSFDVWAGVVQRAPKIFRILGCEWIYRTFKQPQRLKRIYKTLPAFAIKAIIDAVVEKS